MVSVLMSVYKGEKADYLVQSIDSILAQTLLPDQIVIVKDGLLTRELDDILEGYAEKYPALFEYVSLEKNEGLGVALREGIKHCRNELIARMDTDDIAVSTRIEKQISFLKEHPEVDLLGSVYYEFFGDMSNRVLRSSPETHDELVDFMHKRNPFGHDSIIYRKSKVLDAGSYIFETRFEDYDLWIRMVQNGAKVHNLQEPLLYVRGSDDYYSRRGGWKYMKQNVHFFIKHKKNGFFTVTDCIISLLPRCLVCLVPQSIRLFTYKNLLRQKCTEEKA